MKARILAALSSAALVACGGGGSDPTAPSASAPSVTVSVNAPTIFLGQDFQVTWNSTNSAGCSATEGFTGSLGLTGNQTITPSAAGDYRVTVQCTGAGGTNQATQVVKVTNPISAFTQSVLEKSADAEYLNYEPTNKTSKLGSYAINTGVWGVKSATQYSMVQTGEVNVQTDIVKTATFTWDITGSPTPGVVAFPNVTFGRNPGVKTSTTTKLPAQINSIPDLILNTTVDMQCATVCWQWAMYNSFIVPDPAATTLDQGLEIIVNLNSDNGGIPPAHFYVGDVIVSGITFHAYYNSFQSTWNNVVYVPPTGTVFNNVPLNFKHFMNDVIARGYASGANHLMSVELGAEIVRGKGSMTITRWEIK